MRRVFYFALMCFVFLLVSCNPQIKYLGDTYAPSKEVDVYYDERDVLRPYKIMGKLANNYSIYNDEEKVRIGMLEEARFRGADGIIFNEFTVETVEGSESSHTSTSASLIRYTD